MAYSGRCIVIKCGTRKSIIMSVLRMWSYWSSCVYVLVMVLVKPSSVHGVSSNISCSSVRTKYHGTTLQEQVLVRPLSGKISYSVSIIIKYCDNSWQTCLTFWSPGWLEARLEGERGYSLQQQQSIATSVALATLFVFNLSCRWLPDYQRIC